MSKMKILSASERREFWTPPKLSPEERMVFFNITESMMEYIRKIDTDRNKIAFVITIGYYKLTGRLFSSKRFNQEDINVIINSLKIKTDGFNWNDYSKSGSKSRIRRLIFEYLGIRSFRLDKKVSKTVKSFKYLKTLFTKLYSLILQMNSWSKN